MILVDSRTVAFICLPTVLTSGLEPWICDCRSDRETTGGRNGSEANFSGMWIAGGVVDGGSG
jgi:hypothetical protein